MIKFATALMLLGAVYLLPTASATPGGSSMPEGCSIKDRSDVVVIMICEPGLGEEVWRAAGRAACGANPFCNVWIWDHADKAPATAPEIDKDLDRARTAIASAVWVNDSESLIIVSKVAGN